MEWWEEKGKEAYRVLGECVEQAILDENAEMAVICGYPLLRWQKSKREASSEMKVIGITIERWILPERLSDLQKRKVS